jgi:hypothetical protein
MVGMGGHTHDYREAVPTSCSIGRGVRRAPIRRRLGSNRGDCHRDRAVEVREYLLSFGELPIAIPNVASVRDLGSDVVIQIPSEMQK